MNMELRGKISALGVNIPLAAIMEGPTITELSRTILDMLRSGTKTSVPVSSSSVASSQKELKQQDDTSAMKPSFIQEHFVKVYSESGFSNDCHLAGLISFDFIDLDTLQLALNHLIAQEIALRTRFETLPSSDELRAVVVAPSAAQYKIKLLDFTRMFQDEESAYKEVCSAATQDANKPFDLSSAPLFRAHLYKYSANRYAVYTAFHHAVMDGVSMLSLWRMLFTTYNEIAERKKHNAVPLMPPATNASSYTEYVEMEQKYIASEKFASDGAFWRQYLQNIDSLRLPADLTPTNKHSYSASKYHFVIPPTLVRLMFFVY